MWKRRTCHLRPDPVENGSRSQAKSIPFPTRSCTGSADLATIGAPPKSMVYAATPDGQSFTTSSTLTSASVGKPEESFVSCQRTIHSPRTVMVSSAIVLPVMAADWSPIDDTPASRSARSK